MLVERILWGKWPPEPEGLLELIEQLSFLSTHDRASGEPARLLKALGREAASSTGHLERTKLSVVAGLVSGARQGGVLREILDADALRELREVSSLAVRAVSDDSRPLTDRKRALAVLSGAPDTAVPILEGIATSNGDPEIRLLAVRALGRNGGEEAASVLLEGLKGYTPALRREAIDALLGTPQRANLLLDRIEDGRLGAPEIEPAQRSRLLQHPDTGVRARAQKAIAAALPDRGQVVGEYRAALTLQGDMVRGRQVFGKLCSGCHSVAGLGVDVGPDISDTRERSAEALLVDILDPNRAIDGNYLGYTLVTRDRRVLTGVISGETSSAVTLKGAGGRAESVVREEIQSLSSSGLSPMPEGLERDLTLQDAADLLRFLKGWRYDS